MNINEFFNHLASNNSRNFKIEQLNTQSDNVLLKKVIHLALDPFTTFFIRKIPDYVASQEAFSLEHGLELLSDLSSRKVTGNAAIEHLREILSNVSTDDAKVIERIIKKDLKCGVSIATANAVWKNLIKEFPCMLCSPYEQKLVDKIKFPAYAQKKEDGARVAVIVKNNAVEFRTRNGKELDFLGNLEEEFINISNGKDIVFDGELLIKNENGFMDRQGGNGILSKSQKGTLSNEEAARINVIIWDMIPYDKFLEEKDDTPYHERLRYINDLDLPEKISLVETTVVNSIEEAELIFEEYLAEGQEGIILKDFYCIWESKRSKKQIKFKNELFCELLVVGYQKGEQGSKYEGMLGALVCESEDSVVKVNVGSGFSDEQRKEFTSENMLGKIISVTYNSRIINKTGDHSLFLPRFGEIRIDKDIADFNEDIK